MIARKLHLLLLACSVLCVTAIHAGDSTSDPDFSLDLRDVDVAMEMASTHFFGYATQMQADCGKKESNPDLHRICSERKMLALAAAEMHQKEMEQAEGILGNVGKAIEVSLRNPDQNAPSKATDEISKNLKLLRLSVRRLQSLSEAYQFKDGPLAKQMELVKRQGVAAVPAPIADGLDKRIDRDKSRETKNDGDDH